ncbi:MAG: hypothetical protein B6I26_00630 [Desulfobacteraceae bacterium 4572_130]|nr:MAG: hypothetical protein B6I26_00630 [Desulfobacteraceae bacterium 4572_130]
MVKTKKIIWQFFVIIGIAFILGISVNYFRAHSLSLNKKWSVKNRLLSELGTDIIIDLEQAKEFFLKKEALFIDARPVKDYKKSHIKGALSLPWDNVEKNFMNISSKIFQARIIIIYCDGETCELSHHLGKFLKNAGFENIKILINGLTVWKEETLPIEKKIIVSS